MFEKLKDILTKKRKGAILILTYALAVSFLIFCASLLSKAIAENNLAHRIQLETQAFYLAEGATEAAISDFINKLANYELPQNTSHYNSTVIFNSFNNTQIEVSIDALEEADRLISEWETKIMERNYKITATAIHPDNPEIKVRVNQIITRRLIPTFQHAVFYEDDLEILTGPNMQLQGRIHCNKDIYVDAGSGSNLTIDSFYFRSAGNIYNQRKDNQAPVAGEVYIRVNKSGSAQYVAMDNLDSDEQNWLSESQNRWKGTVQNAVHGITKLSAPSVGSIQPQGYYYNQAGLVIINNQIIKEGRILQEGIDYPPQTITSSTSFYNNREKKYIKMTNLDLSRLGGGTFNNTTYPNNLPSNGLIYVSRNDVSGAYQAGIRIINGTEIKRSGGLTVVTNLPAYIQGDFNTVNEQPASIIADSLNILSNKWRDDNSRKHLNYRAANPTTINCAFIAGIHPTEGTSYSGGLENYPRLHEKWSGITLTIKGSFVQLWNSTIATGKWQYGNPYYTAPNRNWSYNSAFNDKPPPFTPWAVEAERAAWWKERV